ncbi:hypothetical protein Bbelb_335060 [Branchiostoma belcheri]|nr:hypothetical protein Bbelb_335060 [Branchiostoma belcheri]
MEAMYTKTFHLAGQGLPDTLRGRLDEMPGKGGKDSNAPLLVVWTAVTMVTQHGMLGRRRGGGSSLDQTEKVKRIADADALSSALLVVRVDSAKNLPKAF